MLENKEFTVYTGFTVKKQTNKQTNKKKTNWEKPVSIHTFIYTH